VSFDASVSVSVDLGSGSFAYEDVAQAVSDALLLALVRGIAFPFEVRLSDGRTATVHSLVPDVRT